MSLFVGNLPKDSSKELLEEEFSKFGKCQVNYFVRFTQGKFAFVEYQLETEAEEARQTWDSREFHGQILKVEISQIAPGNKKPQTTAPPDKGAGEEPPAQKPLEEHPSELSPPDTKPPEQLFPEEKTIEQEPVQKLFSLATDNSKFDIENDKGIEEILKGEPLSMDEMKAENPQAFAPGEEEVKKTTGKRGRPRKIVEEGSEAATTNANPDEVKVPRKRGRPRKVPLAEGEEPPKKADKLKTNLDGTSPSKDGNEDDDILNAPRAARTRKIREAQPIWDNSDSEVDEEEDSPAKQPKASDESSDYSPKSDTEAQFAPEKDPPTVIAEDGTVFKRVKTKYLCPICNKAVMFNSINAHVRSSAHKRNKANRNF